MKETFDFSTAAPATSTAFLAPGLYKLSVSDVKYTVPTDTKPDGSPKTPFLAITFSGKSGQLTEKFFITPKAIDRLQYLHEALSGKRCDKIFESTDQVGAYFSKFLMAKKVEKTFLVGGTEATNGTVYANLGYGGFIMPDDMDVQEGAFPEGSAMWNANVKKNKNTSVSNTDDIMLPGSTSSSKIDDIDSLPW